MFDDALLIFIPTIKDDDLSIVELVKFNNNLRSKLTEQEKKGANRTLIFDLSQSEGMNTLGIIYMAVISNYVKTRGWGLYYRLSGASEVVQHDFEVSGFNQRYFKNFIENSDYINDKTHNRILFKDFYGNSIEDIEVDVLEYIEKQWFKEANFIFDKTVYSEMLGIFIEMFANAAEHSGNGSTVGIGAYGTIDLENKNIYLALIDLGKGIANKVQYYWSSTNGGDISDVEAVKWALAPNHTTRSRRLGGQGFTNIRQFLKINQGSLDIITNSVHAKLEGNLETKMSTMDVNFSGTILIFKLNNETVRYYKKPKKEE